MICKCIKSSSWFTLDRKGTRFHYDVDGLYSFEIFEDTLFGDSFVVNCGDYQMTFGSDEKKCSHIFFDFFEFE